jgi:hypothetical protein
MAEDGTQNGIRRESGGKTFLKTSRKRYLMLAEKRYPSGIPSIPAVDKGGKRFLGFPADK